MKRKRIDPNELFEAIIAEAECCLEKASDWDRHIEHIQRCVDILRQRMNFFLIFREQP